MMLTKRMVEEAVEAAILEAEADRAMGRMGNGHWHAMTAHITEEGIEIHHREEASPCYSESEYFSKEWHPVTFWTCKELFSSSPAEGDRYWEECGWEEASYIHPANKWGKYLAANSRIEILEAAAEIANFEYEEINEAEEEIAKKLIEAHGWVPFKLGDLIEQPDIAPQVDEAVEQICSAWGIK